MSDPAWFFLTIGCSALVGGLVAYVVGFIFTRNLWAREQAVIDAENELHRQARRTAAETQAAIHEIQVEDRLAVENDDTVTVPKVDHG